MSHLPERIFKVFELNYVIGAGSEQFTLETVPTSKFTNYNDAAAYLQDSPDEKVARHKNYIILEVFVKK